MPSYPTRIRKADDPKSPLNQCEMLGKIPEASQGLVCYITLLQDRMVFTFRDGYTAFKSTYKTMREDDDLVFLRTYQVNNHDEDEDSEDPKGNTTIHKFQVVNSNSKILLKRMVSSDENNLKSWNYLVLLDPSEDSKIKAKELLLPFEDTVSLSLVETALDFHLSDESRTDDFTRIFNHYVCLKYSRKGTYNEYEDTAWRAKNGKMGDGAKGTRTYSKDENNQLFSRHELQSNWGQLRHLGFSFKNIPLKSTDINIFQYIYFCHGLNESTLNKVTSAFSKRFLNNNKDNPLVSKMMKSTLQEIYRTLILKDLGITTPAELKSVPAQKQIDVYKEYNDSLGGENKVSTFFPLISSWEELFDITREELASLDITKQVKEKSTILDSPSDVTDGGHNHDQLDGLSEGESQDLPNRIKDDWTHTVISKVLQTSSLQGEEITYPPKTWQQVGRAFLHSCKDNLMRSGTPWEILRKHGIDESMVDIAELGWNPYPFKVAGIKWGLDKEEWQIITIPEGLVIPQFVDFELTCLSIYSPDYINNSYHHYVIPGSSEGSCLAFKGFLCNRTVVVDCDLDSIFLKQVVGDMVNILSLGSVDKLPDLLSQRLLNESSRILIAIGNTPEGIQTSQWLLDKYGNRVRILPRILGKDLYQSFINKENIRRWITSDITGDNADRYLRNDVVPSMYFKELTLI